MAEQLTPGVGARVEHVASGRVGTVVRTTPASRADHELTVIAFDDDAKPHDAAVIGWAFHEGWAFRLV